jgi:uncharacterized protein (TIGR03067 family)
LQKLQGSWGVVSSQVGEEKAPGDEVKRRKVTITGNKLIYDYGNEQKEKQEGTIKLDPKTKAFDWTWTFPENGATMLGIYELKGDDLIICFGNDGLVRPRHFVIGKDDVVWLLILKRDKAEQNEKKAPAGKDPPNQAKQTLDMVLKGFQAYQDSKRSQTAKGGESADKAARDLYAEAFRIAFRISSEFAKAMGQGQTKAKREEAVLDAYAPAFVQAYERAKTLKKALEEQEASGSKGNEKAIEALDTFLKVGKDVEHVVKLRARNQAVEHARQEIESALRKVQKTTQDWQTALQALDDIERAVKEMRKKTQQGKAVK